MRASAHTLEEMLGHDHPTILMTWNTLAWYQRGSAASGKNFVAQYRKALGKAEADLGAESAVAIGILFDFLYHVFYVLQERAEEDETGKIGGCCARSMAEDLLGRCVAQMEEAGGPGVGEPLVIVFRAYASAMLMVGILELEAGDTARFCARIVEAAAALRRRGYSEMAEMLELDCKELLAAAGEKKDLRGLPLNLSRPRCSDAEREVYV